MDGDQPPSTRKKAKAHKSPTSTRLQIAASAAVGLLLVLMPLVALGQRANELAQTNSEGIWPELAAAAESDLSWLITIFVVLTLLNALFVMGNTAFDLLQPIHRKFFDNEPANQLKIDRAVENKALYVSTCNLGIFTTRALLVVTVVYAAPMAAAQVSNMLGAPISWETVMLTALLLGIPLAGFNLLFAELIPKGYAESNPVDTTLRVQPAIRAFGLLFGIPAKIVLSIANLVTKRFGSKATFEVPNLAEEEIRSLLEAAESTGEIEGTEKDMLTSVFEFGDTVAREIMTPRVDLDSVPLSASLDDIIGVIKESGHSRIPVYKETDDEIVGIIHAKDILEQITNGSSDFSLEDRLRPAYFVPENKRLHDLLQDMKTKKTQIVIIQDEFGGTAGIVTIEDIVEELVGEIVDEYDVDEPDIIELEDGFIVGGKLHLDDVNDAIGDSLESDEFDTVGGFVFGLFGRQPSSGESIDHEGLIFTVMETDGRRISKLKVERIALPIESDIPETAETS